MTPAQFARMIDHTQLRAYATQIDIAELCGEAQQYGFAAVTVNPAWTSYCAKRLAGSGVGIDAVVGFPLGATTAHVKVEEAHDAVRCGATEIDMVINVGALKSGFPEFVEREIGAIVKAVRGIPVKVILETGYLTAREKVSVCKMCVRCGAAYVKTSTGYGNTGATVEDVALLRRIVGNELGVKAAGGIRTYADVMAMVDAGATRIGTSSAVPIMESMRNESR
ncbi:MAG TPA: deoxyribose-phosphate aldolase [Candidatus Hydrogenedentes bacterium]|nr:deoxyribose-phosphate aldolase [Candidatus Hydrogenedentota bacterium]